MVLTRNSRSQMASDNATSNNAAQIRMLVINPNTSKNMTDALEPVVKGLGYENVTYTFYTCPSSAPSSIPSINSPHDALLSAHACWPTLQSLIPSYDAFLVACYSQHPLVSMIRSEITKMNSTSTTTTPTSSSTPSKTVTGIFESSILSSLSLLSSSPTSSFGIVSTGAVWGPALTHAVNDFFGLGSPSSHPSSDNNASVSGDAATETKTVKSLTTRFITCTTTGLSAGELHDLPAATVREKMKGATRELIEVSRTTSGSDTGAGAGTGTTTGLGAICLGCAGMVGLESAVREACIEVLGDERGRDVKIVDGVRAGVGVLVGGLRAVAG